MDNMIPVLKNPSGSYSEPIAEIDGVPFRYLAEFGGNSRCGPQFLTFSTLPTADVIRRSNGELITAVKGVCDPGLPCMKYSYARRQVQRKGRVWAAHLAMNTELLRRGSVAEWGAYMDYRIRQSGCRAVRLNDYGDIVSIEQLKEIMALGERHKDVFFMMFTKKYGLLREFDGDVPENVRIIVSLYSSENIPIDLIERFPCSRVVDVPKSGKVEEIPIVSDVQIKCQFENCTYCVMNGTGCKALGPRAVLDLSYH